MIANLVLKSKKLVGTVKHSYVLTGKLKIQQERLGYPKIKLVQDVPTRWHSTHDLIQSIVNNQDPLNSLILETQHIILKQYVPNENEYRTLCELCSLLAPLREISVALSGSHGVSGNLLSC